jgi:chorismate lyase/3-hydroxybenzoate synthase
MADGFRALLMSTSTSTVWTPDRARFSSDAAKAAIRQVLLPAGAGPTPTAGEALLASSAYGLETPVRRSECGPPRAPTAFVPLEALGGHCQESWYAAEPARYCELEGIQCASSADFLFGIARVPGDPIDTSAEQTYTRIIRLARSQGYPALIRLWNYFPSINADSGGLERYRRFCVGRYKAFEASGYAFGEDLPAASAIGSLGNDLWVSFIAGRHAPRQIENPRQLSAYLYPPSYGPRSPSFSRAMEYAANHERYLFISGTASILSHETVHAGDPLRQCETTLENIRIILRRAGFPGLNVAGPAAAWKVYLRRREDFDTVRHCVSQATSSDSATMYLVGDICRKDLLLEIEGFVSDRTRSAITTD